MSSNAISRLQQIKDHVDAGRLKGTEAIALCVGKVINQNKVAKHFELDMGDNRFAFARKHEAFAAEAALDSIYTIRTSVAAERMEAADCVRNYKALANVERRVPQPEDNGPEGATEPPPHG